MAGTPTTTTTPLAQAGQPHWPCGQGRAQWHPVAGAVCHAGSSSTRPGNACRQPATTGTASGTQVVWWCARHAQRVLPHGC